MEQEEREEDVLLVAADEEGRAPASCPTGGSSRTVCFPSITGTALDGFAAHDPPRTHLRGKEGGVHQSTTAVVCVVPFCP